MKKAMIIGKFNEVTKQISDNLAKCCRVQICADDPDVVEGMLRLVLPDLIIVSLVGTSSANVEIFSLLSRETLTTQIVVVGTRENERVLTEEGHLPNKRIHFLRRPIKLEAVVECAKDLLKVEKDDQGRIVRTILVVDDNPTLLRTMQNMLSKKYRVTFATSGPQAIMAISKARPDLILLDYDMPVCDGKMTLKMLRSEEETKDIPVVFLTGMSDPTYVGEVLSLHPQGYLLKPPTEEKIFSAIRSVLGDDEEENQDK